MCAHQVRAYVRLVSTDDRTNEPSNGQPAADHAPVQQYQIRVGGLLGSRWAAWFDGLTLTHEDDGTTVISGPVVDQAALHGVLQKLRDIGITLLSVSSLSLPTAIDQTNGPHNHTDHQQPGATS